MSPSSLPILVVTGLDAERRLAAGPQVQTVCAGGSPIRLRAMLGEIRPAFRAVVSFGMAGGLDPSLAPGDTVLATGVVATETRWTADPDILSAWGEFQPNGIRRVVQAEIAGVEATLLTAAEKARLRAATGAVIGDMESHVAAAFAAEHGIPFAALRTVCDPAGRMLPSLVSKALHPNGCVSLLGILDGLLRQPTQVAALPRLARDASAALASLRRCRTLLGVAPSLAHSSRPLGNVP